MMPESPMLQAALRYAELGYPVFPCVPEEKRPITEHGLHDATTDSEQIERWWTEHPKANVAIRTDGLVVIDDDTEDGWLGDQDERWTDLAKAPSSQTPRGGRHYWFRQPADKAWRNTQGVLAPKVDTRASGGYVLVPPSMVDSKSYFWPEGYELTASRDRLPEPPRWLISLLEANSLRPLSIVEANQPENRITEGKRNGILTGWGGAMRRAGLHREAIEAALIRANQDRCAPPLDLDEVRHIAASVSRYRPDAVSIKLLQHQAEDLAAEMAPLPPPKSMRELMAAHESLRPPVVHGLLRVGETMNVISLPKLGKSWLVIDLGLSVACGRSWLDTYPTEGGDVLLLDNELHGETSAHRLPKVAFARGIPLEAVEDRFFVLNLRGQLKDLFSLQQFFDSIEPGRYRMVILDAFYRFMPRGTEENDNAAMASLYNKIDQYADHLGCSFVLIHHTTKGSQSTKLITDVGAGAGSQARATDTHLILRPHEEPDVVVLEASVRSWPPVVAQCLRWVFPAWVSAPELDPAQLRNPNPRRKAARDEELTPDEEIDAFVREFMTEKPQTLAMIQRNAKKGGISGRKAKHLLQNAEGLEKVHRWTYGSREPIRFATIPKPDKTAKATAET